MHMLRLDRLIISFYCFTPLVLHFLVVTFGPAFSGTAFSSVSSFWSPIFRSCIFSRPPEIWLVPTKT